MPKKKTLDLQSPPSFSVPLRRHVAPQGYECSMSCAIKGDPTPHVTWYLNNTSLNTNTNYYITNVCGVCSLLIPRVSPKDGGEYKVVVENKLGTAESSMVMNVRGMLKRLIGETGSLHYLMWTQYIQIQHMFTCVFTTGWRSAAAPGHKLTCDSSGKHHIQITFLEVLSYFSLMLAT